MDLRCSRHSLPVHWNRTLSNNKVHLAAQHQMPLSRSNCQGCGHKEDWCMHSMLTALMQISEVLTTTFEDDVLKCSYFTLGEEKFFLQVLDNECAGNLNCDFGFSS